MKRFSKITIIAAATVFMLTVAAAASVPNGGFEQGTLGLVPTSWVEHDSCKGPGTCTHEMKTVNTRYYEGSRSLYLHSRNVDGGIRTSHVTYTTAWTANYINSPGSDSVRWRMRDISATHTTYWGWGTQIWLCFTDGVNTAYVTDIWYKGESKNDHFYDNIMTGADGNNWFEYTREIPANIDKTNMKIGIMNIAGCWSWYGYYSDLKFYVDKVELIQSPGITLDSTVDLSPYFDWGAISSYPGLAPPGNMGIFCPPHGRGCYFPSDSLTPGGSYPKAWLTPGVHLATDYGPANVRLPANPMVTVPDRVGKSCTLMVEVPRAGLIDQATDQNVIQISPGETRNVSIFDNVGTMVFLANCDGWAEFPGGPSPDQPLEIQLKYGDGTADTVITDSIHPAGRLDIVFPSWIFIYGNEVFVCDPAYFDIPTPYYDPYHSEAWHWYTLYPDTMKLLDSVTFVGIQSGFHSEIYIGAVSYSEFPCCNHDGIRGDVDYNMSLDVGDLTYLVAYLFQGGQPPPCLEEADVNGDGSIDVGDLTYLVAFLFQGGPAPMPCDLTKSLPQGAAKAGGGITLNTTYEDGMTVISLESSADVRGIQIELSGKPGGQPTSLVDSDLEFFFYQDGDAARIGILDLEGAALIKKGTSALVQLAGRYEIIEAVVSDLNHNAVIPAINPVGKPTTLPDHFELCQNYPNPFNPSTVISFSLPDAAEVRLNIYNIMGQQVATIVNGQMEAGQHSVTWDGSKAASGVYFYRLETGEFTETKKMILLK